MSAELKTYGLLAEFSSSGELIHAAEKVRDAGYKNWDAHSPFPIHGMNDAMGTGRSILGWFVGLAALAGVTLGLGMQGWMSAVDYPVVISGKAFFSYQAFFPVTFALGVLLSIFTSVFGMLALVKMKFHNPIFYSDSFKKVSDDGFFITIMAKDKNYETDKTGEFLSAIGGTNVETLEGE